MTTKELSTHLQTQLTPLLGPGEARSVTRLFLEDLFGARPGSRPRQLTQDEQILAWASLNRLKAGEPIQYVTGVADFYGMQLQVTPDVLIPRPETEELVEWILEAHKNDSNLTIADIGTGSGCIAIALKAKRPDWTVTGFDISKAALSVANNNARTQGQTVEFQQWDMLKAPLPGKFSLLVSNPPYIPPSERAKMSASTLKHEPELALFVPEDDPLVFYRRLASFATPLYCETNAFNHGEVVQVLGKAGFGEVESRKDLEGRERMVRAWGS